MAVVSKSSKRGRVGLIVGLLIAAGGVAGTVALRLAGTGNQPTTATVVVAAADIPAATPIQSDMLTTKQISSTSVPPSTFSDPSTLIGQLPQVPITKGTIVVAGDFVGVAAPANNSNGTTGTQVAPVAYGFVLKDGYVAIAMPVDPELAVGYYIQPHDHVDFIIGAGSSSGGPATGVRYGFQDVEVLAVGGNAGAGAAAASSRQDGLIVVALPRRQAEELALMIAAPTQAPMTIVRLVLRPKDAYGKGALDSGGDSPFTGHGPNDSVVSPATLNNIFR